MAYAEFRATFRLALLCVGMFASFPQAAEPEKGKEKTKANRLAKESSPYLLQHAHNPVDWYPWGPEAFAKAKKEKKLIFLSIGYSSCHWCHVMEKESFEDKDVAELLNKHFVSIKVDREERPDIDDIYMTALHAMETRGGWPISMFLTPDGKPIIGGTYWPREDREIDGEKIRGLKTILKNVQEVWEKKPAGVTEQAELFADKTNEALEMGFRGQAIVALDRALANSAAELVRENIDPVHGGIGSKERRFRGTKFPMAATMGLLLDHAVRDKDDELLKLVLLTLDKMAAGGIYDQIGGGFHRYSTERTWTVPHFEKMLYDNAQLLELYANAYRITKNPTYARIIRETQTFIDREMTSLEGGFYSALDADSNGNEGEFYVWTSGEIEKCLGNAADASLARAVYGVTGNPNFEEKFYIFKLPRPLDAIAAEQKLSPEELAKKLSAIKTKLLDFRAKRVRPFLDKKILTAWNGQMIAGLAKAGEVLKEPDYLKSAARAADFVLKNLRTKEGRLLRVWSLRADGTPEAKLNAYLDDYAFMIHGLLNLHEATGEQRWLDQAKTLTDLAVKWHGDTNRGGFYFTSSDHEKLFARPKDYFDGAQPSANGIFTRDLIRLWLKTKDEGYRKEAERSFKHFAGILRANPSSVPGLCVALHLFLDAKPEVKEFKSKPPETPSRIVKTEDLVKLTATAEKPEDGKQVLTVKLVVEKPWHIYANPTGNPKVTAQMTKVTVRANGKEIDAEVTYPPGVKEADDTVGDYFVYENEITIKVVIPRQANAGPIDVWTKVQACTKLRCLQQTTLKTTVK